MKVAQNDETNPDTQSVRPPHIPSIANTQLFPSDSSVRKRETPGNIFPDVSPLHRYHPIPRQGTPSTATCYVMHRYASVCIVFIVSSPLFSPVDYETDAATGAPTDYVVDDPSFLPEQPGKPPL